jgi:hypothetical protein
LRRLRFGLLAAVAWTGCGIVLGLEERELDPTFGQTSGSTPGGPCSTPGDCPQAGNACFVRACVGGKCGLTDAPPGTAVLSQVDGDCKRVECDASGNPADVADAEDFFDDGRPCTVDLCDGMKPTHQPAMQGIGCPGGICNAVGSCVECGKDEDCDDTMGCPAGVCFCDDGHCVPNTCKDGTQNLGETDVDCGGTECNPCDDGEMCAVADDCTSSVCNLGMCQAPTCMDTVKNGAESDVDCGPAPCTPCGDGQECSDPTHCVSGVCGGDMPKTCQSPTCTDGVMNGDELAVDCGGAGCQTGSCDDNEPCASNSDCASGVCMGTCQVPTCSDGVQNQTETGVDCGDPCPAC